jgi:PAS domain-containing protein
VVREDGSDFPGEEDPSMVALKTGKPCRDVVAGIYNGENSYTWVTINAVPQFRVHESKPYQVFVTLHDITARKQSEDLLRIQHDLSFRLSNVTSFEEGLAVCLDASLHASGMEAGGIYVTNDETGGVDLVHHRGLSPDFVKSEEYFGPDSKNVELLHKKTAFYSEVSLLGSHNIEIESSADFKAICIIPILFQGVLVGCINLTSSIHEKVPDFSRVAIETIAGRIGSWINYNRTKETLYESEERFSLAMDAAQDGIYDWDLIKETLYYSPVGSGCWDIKIQSFPMILRFGKH